MARHHVALSPDGTCLIVAVSGVRSREAAELSCADAVAARAQTGVSAIFFDARAAIMPISPGALVARALACGRVLEPSRVAILTTDPEDTYARLWRRGLVETGHQAMVFTLAETADAWLSTAESTDTLFVA